jgi:hypothetical protein
MTPDNGKLDFSLLRGRWLSLAMLALIISGAGVFQVFTGCESRASVSASGKVDFNYHIRPILSDRCFKCHGPDPKTREAGLRLDMESGAFAALKDDPGRHVIVRGKPLESELFLRISSTDTSFLMPPPSSHLALTQPEIELIKKWISQGAEFKKHWAFIPPVRPSLPDTRQQAKAINEIDLFILAQQDKSGLQMNQAAEKENLLRRVSTDLTGLPPSSDLQERFLRDNSPDAYDKIVEELLSSRHYGEKMAIAWLDLARYADSHGYQDDGLRTMWPWRDWVIHAFNSNYTFDIFLTWQLAGDLLDHPTPEQLLATGFNRNHKITQEGGVIDEEYRLEYVTDRTNTFGKTFLALTFECAKCHDHKFDPITQKDYYSTFAFFNQVSEKGYQGDIFSGSPADPPNMTIRNADTGGSLSFVNRKDTAPVTVMIMKDTTFRRITRVLKRGVYDQPTDTVNPGLPAAILPFDSSRYLPNRLGLAKWLLDPQHPLTARVFVNRIWQEFFGKGLVKTSGDFGMQGDLPTNPELLDWLAVDFREKGWDIKRLVRQIVTSATYRQSAARSREQTAKDPDNRYYSYSSRLRLPAELLRDHVLYSSGLLNPEIGGPSVRPYQPAGVWEATTSGRGVLSRYIQDKGEKLYRRGLYTFIKRTAPPPSMLIFDAVTRDQCEVSRIRTNTPLQALVMLNDPQVLEASRVLAQSLLKENMTDTERISVAFRRILCRKPDNFERDKINRYHQGELSRLSRTPTQASLYIRQGEYREEPGGDPVRHAALMKVVHLLYNLEETAMRP